jgi:hypothetical protein
MTHLSLCSSQDDTMPNYPNCDCGDDYEQATKARCDDRTKCSPDARHDAVSHGLTSVTLKCRLCGGIFRRDWD